MTQSIRDAEIEAGKILNSELDQHLDLAMKAFGLAGKVLSAIPASFSERHVLICESCN